MADLPEDLHFPYCQEIGVYEKFEKVGQGTFGEVFRGRCRSTQRKVALKKVLMENEKEGFPITALREIKILQMLKHENVVELIEICRTKGTYYNRFKETFYLVFEFCDHDLAGLLSNSTIKFSMGEIKRVMQQLLNGLYFIHSNNILHRDMKAANILVTRAGVIKLADFGLARLYTAKQPMKYTNRVVTLWYRPPELLLGERMYGPPIDIWGAGLIMIEMWTRAPVMQGASEQHQLSLIQQFCGTVNKETFPNFDNLDLAKSMNLGDACKRRVKDRLRSYVKEQYALDLIDKMLIIDPAKRIDADSALNHDFFWTNPMPTELSKLLSGIHNNLFEFLAPPRRKAANPPAAPNQRPGPADNIGQDHHVERVF